MYSRALHRLAHSLLFPALLLAYGPVSAHGDDLFVGNYGGGAVDRYDGTTGAFIGTLATGFVPVGIAVDSGGTVYVANGTTNLIDEFNSNTGSLLGTINVPTRPQDLAFGPGNTLYVTSYPAVGVGSIYKVDLTTDNSTLFANLPEANGIVLASNGDVYATSFGGSSLSHYNAAGTLLGSASLGDLGYGVTIGTDGFLYASNTQDIERINPTTLASSVFISAGSGGLNTPYGITTGPDGNLYVSSGGTNEVKEYNGTTGAFITNFVTAGSGGLNTPLYLTFSSAGVPEASSITILALSLVCIGVVLRRRRHGASAMPIR